MLLLAIACKRSDQDNVRYIKIFSQGEPDSITYFNKGLGIHRYLFYDFIKDSICLRADLDTGFVTYTGEISNTRYPDTLSLLIHALKKYPNGPIVRPFTGNAYCGPIYYVEFQVEDQIHSYVFGMSHNDTVDLYMELLYRVNEYNWPKTQVANSIIDRDSEVVNAYKQMGVWDRVETPYIRQKCDPIVDRSKIYGVWRSSGDNRFYLKVDYQKNGKWYMTRVKDTAETKIGSGEYFIHRNKPVISIKTTAGISNYRIIHLTENCFDMQAEKIGRNGIINTIRYDRYEGQ